MSHAIKNMHLLLVQPTAFCLDLRSDPQERIHVWYCQPGQGPWLREVIGSSAEATVVVFISVES